MKLPRRYVYLLLVGIGVLILCYFLLEEWINHKISEKVTDLNTADQEIVYSHLSTSLLSGELVVDNIYYESRNKFKISAKQCQISGISLLDLWLDKDISASQLRITSPRIIQYVRSSDTLDQPESGKELKSSIAIEDIEITDGKFIRKKMDSLHTSVMLTMDFESTVKNVLIDSTTIKKDMPLTAKDFKVKISTLNTHLNTFHLLKVKTIAIDPDAISLNHYEIVPLVSEKEFNHKIDKEQDYMRLQGKSIHIATPQILKQQDKPLLTSSSIVIDSVAFDISRNKRLPDDTRIKPMYSKMLRDLPCSIRIDSVRITNGCIRYTEQPDNDLEPGLLEFDDLQLSANTLSNLPDAEPVKIAIESSYMNQAKITLDWEMDVNDPEDVFHIQGAIKDVEAKSMNAFIAPTLNVKAEGKLDAFYYNFRGNGYQAIGESSIRINEFKIKPVRHKAKMLTSVLTGLANMIIGGKEKKGLITEKEVEVTRDQTKSFWNYFWLCIRNGLLETVK